MEIKSSANQTRIHLSIDPTGASLKILQLLQHFEHVVSPMAQAVQVFVDQFGIKSVTSELMRYVYYIQAIEPFPPGAMC